MPPSINYRASGLYARGESGIYENKNTEWENYINQESEKHFNITKQNKKLERNTKHRTSKIYGDLIEEQVKKRQFI